MGLLTGRYAGVRIVLALLVVCLAPGAVLAQTTVVLNPRTLAFTPSADHNTVLSDGRAAVDHYNFNLYSVGATQPFQSTNVGKPAPATDGNIYYDFSASVAGWPLPGGNYEARVVAVGPMGSGTSDPSNPFTFSSCTYALSGSSASLPAAGGGTQVSVTTSSGCSWTAASNVAWVTVSPTSATGNATVVATVAASTSSAARTGTLTVAGQTFTINQAGTSVAAASTPASPSPASGATGVSVTPMLTWTASGATSYSIALGTTNPPAQAASGLTTASYAPGTLAAGATYYWRVTAISSGGSTTGPLWSFTTAASTPPPTTTLPSPWNSQDIGSVVLPGSASASNGTFTVKGGGADIWGSADAFQYVNQPVSGNIEIVARVTSEQNTNQYAKAGVMLRESLTANAAHVILDVLPGGGVEFLTRTAAGGSTTSVASTTQAMPTWVRLTRNGGTVTGAVSADGVTWRTVGSTTVTMSTSGYAGPAVTSHNTSATNTATFDNVSVRTPSTGGLPTGWSNQDVGSVVLKGSTSYASATGTFTVTGAGADIWGTADAFQYASQPASGNVEIIARVTGLQNTNPYAKAGVMIREALTASAAHVMLDVLPGGSIELLTRSAAGATTTYLGGAAQAPPAWLRLTRSGSTVTAAVSPDGATWRTVGSTTVTMGASSYAGLAVTSHYTAVTNTATFDHVSVTGAVTGVLPTGWVNQDVGSVVLTGSTSYASASGTFTVTGAGADIWGTADAFQFASRPLAGDGQIVARVTAIQNTDYYAKAGVMLRADVSASGAHVLLDLLPNGSVELLTRSASGGTTLYLGGASQQAPCWLRLVRSGLTVTAAVSSDGTTWRTVGSTTVSFGSAYVGLAVNSHNTAARSTATFDNVTVR